MFAIKVDQLARQVGPCRFTLGERVAITKEAMRRGSNAEFLDTDDDEQLAAIGDPDGDDGFAVGCSVVGDVTVASLRTGRVVARGATVDWAMTAWRALG